MTGYVRYAERAKMSLRKRRGEHQGSPSVGGTILEKHIINQEVSRWKS